MVSPFLRLQMPNRKHGALDSRQRRANAQLVPQRLPDLYAFRVAPSRVFNFINCFVGPESAPNALRLRAVRHLTGILRVSESNIYAAKYCRVSDDF